MLSAPWLWILAALYLLFEVWRGWRRGIVRHGISVVALLTAGGVAWVFGWATGFISDNVIPLPIPLGRVLFGFAAGMAFYIAAVVLSSLLFKKTSQQSGGLIRLVYGIGGAFFGVIFGLLVLWGGISLVRMVEAIMQGQEVAMTTHEAYSEEQGKFVVGKTPKEQEASGSLVDKIDIVPPQTYQIISQLMALSRSPDAVMRFFSYPETQKLLAQPKIQQLLQDPSVAKAVAQGNFIVLLSNPKILAVAFDPEVQEAFSTFDLPKALDYALHPPSPSSHSSKNE